MCVLAKSKCVFWQKQMCVVVAVPVTVVAEPVDWSGCAAGFSKSKCVFW